MVRAEQEHAIQQQKEYMATYMKKLSNVKVTLWDLMSLGTDEALLSKMDDEGRAMHKKLLEMQKPPEYQ